jgi:hypothetical protein
MEASTHPTTGEQTTQSTPKSFGGAPPIATLFTSFGLGKSYIFHVAKDERSRVQDCWEEIFSPHKGWSFEQLKNYDKPLGETAKLTLNAESCGEAATPIEKLRKAFEDELSTELDTTKVETVFFTTGVAVLVLRLKPRKPEGALQLFETLQDEAKLKEIRGWLRKIIRLCKDLYLARMDEAEKRTRESSSSSAQPKWSLHRFKEVDREGWEPKQIFSYPLFSVDQDTYKNRIETILGQVTGSKWQRKRQSDEARVSYKGAEIYVDWSEALVSNSGDNLELIENNFIIAFASWYALILMNKNSSIFLFEAYLGTVTNQPQSTARSVHQKNMAYKDVTDASLPIRWTTRRKDLFLLETIHRNWSSERWRENIEERMKLLTLHYESLEAERNEHSNKKLAIAAAFLTLFTLASAIADMIALAENDDQKSYWIILGYPLKGFDLYLSLTPVLIGILLVGIFWLKPKLRARGNNNR